MALGTPSTASQAPSDDFVGRRPRWRRSVGWLVVVAIAVAISVVLRLFVVQTFFVPSGSMEKTLLPGDRMLVLKLGYSVQRGAVLVFHHPPAETPAMCGDSSDDDLVKRVIGLPGEVISSRGNTVYIDGRPLKEPWLPPHQQLGPPIATQKIPQGEYFMMGDNRTDSCDSRRWGPIPASLVIGRVFVVLWRDGHPVFDVI
ncbi:MAG: signal peptidase I [Acidimicrobiales bacterium]